jgi:acetoacetate decarboxylase
MGYVKTPEEIERIQRALRRPRFVNARRLSVEFLTEPDTVARVLPPGFEPAPEPLVTAMVGRWQSNCVGDFAGGALYVAARWGDLDGGYVLGMWMDSDKPTIFGRDLYGEPKKLARTGLAADGDAFSGYVDRDGVRLLEVSLRAALDHGPSTVRRAAFNVKARPAADGVGLEEDAIVTRVVNEDVRRVHREGTGAVVLSGTPHDPVDELEVVSVVRGTYVEGDAEGVNRRVGTIAADAFLPWFYGRNGDDWSALSTERCPPAT